MAERDAQMILCCRVQFTVVFRCAIQLRTIFPASLFLGSQVEHMGCRHAKDTTILYSFPNSPRLPSCS